MDERKQDDAQKKAKRVLLSAFANEVMSGEIKESNIDLSAMILSGGVDEHEILPGLLEAHFRYKHMGRFWRRGNITYAGRSADATKAAENNMTRAALFFCQKMRGHALKECLSAMSLRDNRKTLIQLQEKKRTRRSRSTRENWRCRALTSQSISAARQPRTFSGHTTSSEHA